MDSTRAPVAFLDKTYDEAMGLIVETRDYIAYQEPSDYIGMKPGDRIALSKETSRLTTMLMEVMSWLLTQKAVFAEEITRDDAARSEHRLGNADVCLGDSDSAHGPMPTRLSELLDRGERLYVRVTRLDELSRRQVH